MKKIRLFYYIKLYLILILAILLLASVEGAPDHPILFCIIVLMSFRCIKYLWPSMLQDEHRMKQTRLKLHGSTDSKATQSNKRAA